MSLKDSVVKSVIYGGKNEMLVENKITNEAQEISQTEEATRQPVVLVRLKGESHVVGEGPQIVLDVWDFLNEKMVSVLIPRESFSPQTLRTAILSHNGICSGVNVIYKGICDDFDNQLRTGKLDVTSLHRGLGWVRLNDQNVFLGNDAISHDSNTKSSYYGNLDVAPTGSIDDLVNMIKTQITSQEEWSPLEAVLAFGAGSTVLSYANTAWHSSLNNVMIHMVGGSSTGKSTSLALFVSMGSNPTPKKGFWINYNGSEVSIVKRIGNNNGYPVAIDELSNGGKKVYSTLVYTIGNGEEKDRLTGGGKRFQESATFQTVVLSSGEISLLKKCSKDGGVRARCVELPNICWTSSKEQSVAIKECVSANYGLITPLISQELLDNDAKWRERWAYWRKRVGDRLAKDEVKLSVSERIADYVALFTLAGEILNAVLDFDLKLDRIFEFCYGHIIIANEEEGNMSTRAYAILTDYIARNQNKFADGLDYGGCRGFNNAITLETCEDGFYREAKKKKVISGETCDLIYVFRPGVVDRILLDAGFSDSRVCLYRLKEEGYLLTKDAKRYTYPYVINGVKQTDCICLYSKNRAYERYDYDGNQLDD